MSDLHCEALDNNSQVLEISEGPELSWYSTKTVQIASKFSQTKKFDSNFTVWTYRKCKPLQGLRRRVVTFIYNCPPPPSTI